VLKRIGLAYGGKSSTWSRNYKWERIEQIPKEQKKNKNGMAYNQKPIVLIISRFNVHFGDYSIVFTH
jgi:hypothetical protein